MTAFARTFARLLADRGRSTVFTIAGILAVMGAWVAWSAWARVALYEVSSQARVEVDAAIFPIASPFLGRVVAARLRVGQSVRRGDVLVEIDAMADQLQLHQEEVRAQGLAPRLARLRAQIAAERAARAQEQNSTRLSAQEAHDRVREAEISAGLADKELARLRKIHATGMLSERDLERAEAEAQLRHAAVARSKAAAERIPEEQATHERERDVRLERLGGEVAVVEGERETLKATIERLGYEIERRRVRAPVDGRVGEAADLQVGAVVDEGEKLGSIVAAGHHVVVAQFPAQAAFGRMRVGQRAKLRLEGFPWAEFGTLSGSVTHVAQEVRGGSVRVEASIDAGSSFRGELEHGMPGTLEVMVDRVTPLSLVLRSAGQWLTARP